MEKEEDPLALIVAALRDATEAARAAGTVARAARAEAREFHSRSSQAVSDLAKRVVALARDIKAMTPPVRKPECDREARYVWASGGFVIGVVLCAVFFYFLLAATRPHAG